MLSCFACQPVNDVKNDELNSGFLLEMDMFSLPSSVFKVSSSNALPKATCGNKGFSKLTMGFLYY